MFKEEIIPIQHKLFEEGEEKEVLNLFTEASFTLIPKAEKDIIRILQANIPHEYKCKNFKQNFSKSGLEIYYTI